MQHVLESHQKRLLNGIANSVRLGRKSSLELFLVIFDKIDLEKTGFAARRRREGAY